MEKVKGSTEVILVGSGVPTPNPQRMGACVVVVVKGKPILFDCGRGAVIQLVRTGLDTAQVEQVFFTHHHQTGTKLETVDTAKGWPKGG